MTRSVGTTMRSIQGASAMLVLALCTVWPACSAPIECSDKETVVCDENGDDCFCARECSSLSQCDPLEICMTTPQACLPNRDQYDSCGDVAEDCCSPPECALDPAYCGLCFNPYICIDNRCERQEDL